MYFRNGVGTGSYTTSTTNMYHKDVRPLVEVEVGGDVNVFETLAPCQTNVMQRDRHLDIRHQQRQGVKPP